MRNNYHHQQRHKNRKDKKPKASRNEAKADKHKVANKKKVIPLHPKNDRQAQALRDAADKQLLALIGSSGTGKTEIAVWWACKRWLEGDIDNIVITRPYKHLGADYGATKGNDAEKLLVFCMSMLMKIKRYLGADVLKSNFKLDSFEDLFADVSGIQIVPVEKIQGMSFDERTIIIGDEVQNMLIPQVKALTTRSEEGCQIIICGDTTQSALKGVNGLQYLCDKLEDHPHKLASIVRFLPEDCCRYGISAHLTKIFEEDGQW